MAELTFKEGNIHDDIYWSPKQKENFILKHYKNSDRKELDKTAKEISDAIRADERNRMLAKVDKARLISIDRDVQTAYDVQLQAIKSLLEGK